MNIHVSNLHVNLDSNDLKNLFSAYGTVSAAEVALDAFTNKSRGYGYVSMDNEAEAQNAIAVLNKTQVGDNIIEVKEVAPKTVHKGSYRVGNGPVQQYRFKKH